MELLQMLFLQKYFSQVPLRRLKVSIFFIFWCLSWSLAGSRVLWLIHIKYILKKWPFQNRLFQRDIFHPLSWSYCSSMYCFPGVSTVSTSFFFIRLVFIFGRGPLNCPFLFVFTIPFCVCLLRALLYFFVQFSKELHLFTISSHSEQTIFNSMCYFLELGNV